MSEYNLDTVDPHDADECRAGMKRLRDERDEARDEHARGYAAGRRDGLSEAVAAVRRAMDRAVDGAGACQTHLHSGPVPQCRKCWPAEDGDGA